MTHEQIATTLVPRMVLFASFSIASLFSFIPFWGWLDVVFTLMVLIGVCGESSWVQKKLIRDGPEELMPVEWIQKKLKRKFESILIIGIAGELICLPFSLWESAKLNKEAADARLETAKLEQQIEKAKPENRPIASLTANVFLLVEGTNGTDFDLNKRPLVKTFVRLKFGNSEHFKNGWPECSLGCKSSEHLLFGGPGGAETEWDLEFGQGGFGNRGWLNEKDVAGEANKWDTVEFDAFFLPKDTQIEDGEITLTINSTIIKRFTIPPQKAKRPPPDRIIGKSVTVFAAQPAGD